MKLGLCYALGHAFIMFAFGSSVVLFRIRLPSGLDAWAARITGATLVLLGFGILTNLARRTHSHPTVRGRWMLLIGVIFLLGAAGHLPPL